VFEFELDRRLRRGIQTRSEDKPNSDRVSVDQSISRRGLSYEVLYLFKLFLISSKSVSPFKPRALKYPPIKPSTKDLTMLSIDAA
jgi:hypothetical protein